MMKKGYFITLEGPDGCGKTTQLEFLADYIRSTGREVLTTREPGGVAAAEKIRQLLLDPKIKLAPRAETLLYLAARAEHIYEKIRPALEAGKVVICDRFTDSTLVYQGFVRGLDMDMLHQLSTLATDGLDPDLTLLLDAPPQKLLVRRLERGVQDRFENEGLAFQEKVRSGFLLLAKQEPQRIKLVNALQEVDLVRRDLEKLVAAALPK
jgi:dTMP kinase